MELLLSALYRRQEELRAAELRENRAQVEYAAIIRQRESLVAKWVLDELIGYQLVDGPVAGHIVVTGNTDAIRSPGEFRAQVRFDDNRRVQLLNAIWWPVKPGKEGPELGRTKDGFTNPEWQGIRGNDGTIGYTNFLDAALFALDGLF